MTYRNAEKQYQAFRMIYLCFIKLINHGLKIGICTKCYYTKLYIYNKYKYT